MLLDFTHRLPVIESDTCFSSIVVRIRAVSTNDFSMWHMEGDHRKGHAIIMTSFGHRQEWREGNDQRFCDYLVRPPTQYQTTRLHSFRTLSAIPASDHPWTIVERWLLLELGDHANGISSRLRLTDMAVFVLPSYRMDSEVLPDTPFKIPQAPEGPTFWSRLLDD